MRKNVNNRINTEIPILLGTYFEVLSKVLSASLNA
jgi:hypothetical protein